VANKLFSGSCGYIPDICRNVEVWTYRNAAAIPGLTKSLWMRNQIPSGQDRPKSYSSEPCSNNSEVLCIKWAVVGICTGCLARAKTEYQTHGYWIRVLAPMITMWVISINTLELHKWVSYMAWWVDWKSQWWWFTGFWSFGRTIQSGWQWMETRWSLMNHHRFSEPFIKVRFFRQSPNIIWTDTNRQEDPL